jgi:hypothetical protein
VFVVDCHRGHGAEEHVKLAVESSGVL